MVKKAIVSVLCMLVLLQPASVFASAGITPQQTTTGRSQAFSLKFINDGTVPITQIKLTVPTNVKSVNPYLKSNWQFETLATSSSGVVVGWRGYLPVGYIEEFVFDALMPSSPSELTWQVSLVDQTNQVAEVRASSNATLATSVQSTAEAKDALSTVQTRANQALWIATLAIFSLLAASAVIVWYIRTSKPSKKPRKTPKKKPARKPRKK